MKSYFLILLSLCCLNCASTVKNDNSATREKKSQVKLADRFQINIERFLDSVDIERNRLLPPETLEQRPQLFGVYLKFNNKTNQEEAVSYNEVELVTTRKKLQPFAVIDAKTGNQVKFQNDVAKPNSGLPRILLFDLPRDASPTTLVISNQIRISIELAP